MSQSPSLQSPLAEVISNMAPEKANALLAILAKGDNQKLHIELNNLYMHDDSSAEAIRFRVFLLNHQISYLGGGNSKNFKVENIDNNDDINCGSTSVLKVDCRLDQTRTAEAYLRKKSDVCFTPIESERLVNGNDPNGVPLTRTMLVTDFCNGGSLFDERIKAATIKEIVDNTCDRFEQMANHLLNIQRAGCIFPDAKAINWLVDEQGNIKIADTKSFLFTDSNGNCTLSIPENKYAKFLSSQDFEPPEAADVPYGSTCNADSVHAFILGRNLHYYTTGQNPDIKKTDGHDLDFSSNDIIKKIFNTTQGKQIRTLIEALVKSNPADRMSIQDAVNELFIIKNPECRKIFRELNALKIGPNDKEMQTYISEKQQEYRKAEADPAARATLLKGLQEIVHNLNADTAVKEVKNIVSNYRKNAGLFTMGMKDKADRIESAMANVPIEQRTNFILSGGSTEVLKELASHRYLGKRGNVYLDERGHVDTDKAANTFKHFKQKFVAQMTELDAKTNKNPAHDPGSAPNMGPR